jgi:hypothetical protein
MRENGMNTKRLAAACVALAILFVLVTNRWAGWTEGAGIVQAGDALTYLKIAEAAPGFPSQPVLSHHGERFAGPMLVGLTARALGTSPELIFSTAMAAFLCAFFALLAFVLGGLRIPRVARALLLVLALLNPYILRYYLLARGMIPDLQFLIGETLVVFALWEARIAVLLAGALLAALSRQTAVLLVPAMALWPLLGDRWRGLQARVRLAAAVGAPALIAGVVLWERWVARPFTTPAYDAHMFTELFVSYRPLNRMNLALLGEHAVRIFLPHLVPVGLLLVMARFRQARRLPVDFWLALLMAGAVVAQPFLFGPNVVMQNQGRLSSLAFPAEVFALGIAWRAWMGDRDLSPSALAAILALLAIGSLHPRFSIFPLGSNVLFAAMAMACGAAAVVLFAVALKKKSRQTGPHYD